MPNELFTADDLRRVFLGKLAKISGMVEEAARKLEKGYEDGDLPRDCIPVSVGGPTSGIMKTLADLEAQVYSQVSLKVEQGYLNKIRWAQVEKRLEQQKKKPKTRRKKKK